MDESDAWTVPEEIKDECEVVELIPIKSEAELAPNEEVTVEVSLQNSKEVAKEDRALEPAKVLDDSGVFVNDEIDVGDIKTKKKAPKRASSKKPRRSAKKRKTVVDDESDEEFFRQIGVDDESSLIPVRQTTSSRKRKSEPKVEPAPDKAGQSTSGLRPKRNRTVVNYSDPIFIDDVKPKSKERAKKGSVKPNERYALLKSWYEDCLAESSTLKSRSRPKQPEYDTTFQCCCVNDVVSDDTLECPKCKTWQHAECVNYNQSLANYPYYCFRCFKKLPLVKSAGTVIISPEAISQQWVSEVSWTRLVVC